MSRLVDGFRIQFRVLGALMVREIHTHYGRENIGFLWMVGEPLLFGGLVAVLWSALGRNEHGLSVATFVISGYVPLVMFRHAVSRCVWVFRANGGLLYHRQIKILDFVLVRYLLELIGSMMAYAMAITVLSVLNIFPPIHDFGLMLLGYTYFALFTMGMTLVIAPLSEMSEVVEKFVPVALYIMVPLSGSFFMAGWFGPQYREILLYSPPVNMYEMMRSGIFGHDVEAYYTFGYPAACILVLMVLGLALCRRVRANLVLE